MTKAQQQACREKATKVVEYFWKLHGDEEDERVEVDVLELFLTLKFVLATILHRTAKDLQKPYRSVLQAFNHDMEKAAQ